MPTPYSCRTVFALLSCGCGRPRRAELQGLLGLLSTLVLVGSIVAQPPRENLRDEKGDEVQFTEKGVRFGVRWPGKYKLSTKEVTFGPKPEQFATVTLRVWEQREGTFSLLTADYPESIAAVEAKTILDGVRDGLRGPTTLGGTIDLDREIRVGPGSLPGREFQVHAKKNYSRTRVVYLPPRLYQVMVTGTQSQVEGETAERFLNSFSVESVAAGSKP